VKSISELIIVQLKHLTVSDKRSSTLEVFSWYGSCTIQMLV